LIIQAENDDGDLVEMRDGVIKGLSLSTADIDRARTHVIVFNEVSHTGREFFDKVVRPLLRRHAPIDLLWIDPALSFLGGTTNSQQGGGGFLRNMLNPVLREFDCGCVIIHHMNKPKNNGEGATQSASLASGSAEWANHARAVLGLHRQKGDIFELHAHK